MKHNYLENLQKLNKIFTADNILLCQDGPFLTNAHDQKQQYSPIGAALEVIYPNLRSNLQTKLDMHFNLNAITYAPTIALRGYLEVYHYVDSGYVEVYLADRNSSEQFRLMISNIWNRSQRDTFVRSKSFFYLLGMFGIHDQYGPEVEFSDLKQRLEDCIKFVKDNEEIFEPSLQVKYSYLSPTDIKEKNDRIQEMIKQAKIQMQEYANEPSKYSLDFKFAADAINSKEFWENTSDPDNAFKSFTTLEKISNFIDKLEVSDEKIKLKSMAIALDEHFSKPEEEWESPAYNEETAGPASFLDGEEELDMEMLITSETECKALVDI